MDKITIKRQFVKSIGKLFEADRVFFSEYDPKTHMYLPVDEYSEYLSGPEVKSFVGYDWSTESSREYIQPLLEKRELKIHCWDDYIKENPKGQEFIALFEDSNVRSSYNLPVVYQDKIMGYFCIEYAKSSCVTLPDEDINRIRSMCTQAGIALYHADLYVKSQEALREKSEFMYKVSSGLNEILADISSLAKIMADTEVKCEKHLGHVEKINESVKRIQQLTGTIEDNV